MSRLKEIKEYVEKEYSNLFKSKARARSLQGIIIKRQLLTDHLEEFESILKKYEHRLSTDDWNKFTDDFEFVKNKVELALKILDGTAIIPEKEKAKPRRNSEHCLEIVIPDNNQRPSSSSQVENNFLLSSTLNQSLEEANYSNFLEHIENLENEYEKQRLQIDNFTADLDLDDTSFNDCIANLRNKFFQNSFFFNRKFKMPNDNENENVDEYEFPMVTAIQCIPEFHGKPEELQPFIIQVEYFAKKIPAGNVHTPLLNVVYTKLKGEALVRLPEIQDNTWENVKEKLEKVFKLEKTIGTIIKEIETLDQGENEAYESYKLRATKLYRILPDHNNESYAGATLRKHFLGGLRSRALALAGKSQREKSFLELLEWLQREYEEEEELKEIHQRLHPTKTGNSRNNTRQNTYNKNYHGHNSNNQNNNDRGYDPNNNQNYQGTTNRRYNYNNSNNPNSQYNNFRRNDNQNRNYNHNYNQNRSYNQNSGHNSNYNQNYSQNRSYNQNSAQNLNFNQNRNQYQPNQSYRQFDNQQMQSQNRNLNYNQGN